MYMYVVLFIHCEREGGREGEREGKEKEREKERERERERNRQTHRQIEKHSLMKQGLHVEQFISIEGELIEVLFGRKDEIAVVVLEIPEVI